MYFQFFKTDKIVQIFFKYVSSFEKLALFLIYKTLCHFPLLIMNPFLSSLMTHSYHIQTIRDNKHGWAWRKINKLCCIYFDNKKIGKNVLLFSLRHRCDISPTFSDTQSKEFYHRYKCLHHSICGWNFLFFNWVFEILYPLI